MCRCRLLLRLRLFLLPPAAASAVGYKVMRAMGVKMTRLTNSRGFCVELCVAAVIIVASRFGIPLS